MKPLISIAVPLLLASTAVTARNPIIATSFTPDPAPYVLGDTLYLFVDHDEDDAQYFKMKDWQLYTTTDMVNYTYRGTPISTETFKWATQGDKAWASQAVSRNGKWYWYVCCQDKATGLDAVAVAVADRPEGPYRDVLDGPLTPPGWGYIDPSVFIDDDGKAYLFWGNNGLWYAELNPDMISLATGVIPVESLNDEDAFGPMVMKQDYALNKRMLKTGFEEAPWVFKRNGVYYLVYAAGGVPEHMAYSTAPSIHGPWKYRGRIMDEAANSFTIHGGNVNFKGRDFMFYHNGLLPNGDGFRRSSCVEEFTFDKDGSIPFIPFTGEGVRSPAGTLDPYSRVEAETMAFSYGLKTDRNVGSHHYVTSIHNGDWLQLRAVDFGESAPAAISAIASALQKGGSIEFRLDRLGGPIIGEVEITPEGKDKWQTFKAPVTSKEPVKGVHDLYLLFKGPDGELFDFDAWQLSK